MTLSARAHLSLELPNSTSLLRELVCNGLNEASEVFEGGSLGLHGHTALSAGFELRSEVHYHT